MPDPVTGLIAGGATLLGGMMQADAAGDAAAAQGAASAAGIAEQRRQFDAIRELLKPYVETGTQAIGGLQPYAAAGAPALAQQQALAGLAGPSAQRAAISALESSPLFQAQVRQGEEALLSRASATGGLRGGNIQAALAQFRPQMLQSEIEKQYSRLGGLTALGQTTSQNLAQLGQASAAGVGSAGMQTGANIANLMAQQGAAQAGGILGQSAAMGGVLSAIPQGIGAYYGLTGQSPFGSLFGGQSVASQFGTIPGSQQTSMLAAQMQGF